jgi:hypothetical protein
MSVPGFGDCGGTVRNLWEMLDIENRISFHRVLDFGTLVDRDLRVEHTHLARVHAQRNAWTGGRIDLTLVNWSLNFVIVRKRGECAELEGSNLQTGFVHVDRLGLGVEVVWSEADNNYQNSQRRPRKSH